MMHPSSPGPASAGLDPHDFVHGIVEGVFGLVFPDPQARLALRLKSISRAADGAMTWYLWTTVRSGAYALSYVADADDVPGGAARLALRYFPDPHEPLFSRFAAIEREARCSPCFDRTGTPAFASAAALDPDLFGIGTLVIAPQGDQRFALRMHALERWIEEQSQEAGRAPLRDVPCTDLALPVVDALVGGAVYLARTPPASVRAWRHPGAILRRGPDGTATLVGDRAIVDWELEFSGLAVPGRTPGRVDAWALPARDPAPWFGHDGATAPVNAPWPVSALWWHAAHWQFEPVGMFCSHCAAEDAEGHIHIRSHCCEDAHDDHHA
jgi:hypothetical protein